MRRAQAERSRTHARTRTRTKEEDEHASRRKRRRAEALATRCVQGRAPTERKEGRSGNKPPRPSLNVDNFCSPFSRLFAYRDFNLFATMWANNVRFLFAGFIRYQLRERNTDNVRNLLEFANAWIFTTYNLRNST